MRKIIFIVILFILSIISISIIVFLTTTNKELRYTTIKNSYNVVSEFDNSDSISIPIYASLENEFLFDVKNINCCYIKDEKENNVISLKLISIEKMNSIEINNDNYIVYNFNFLIDFKTKDFYEVEIIDAYLHLNYLNLNSLIIPIGSFSYYKISEFLDSTPNLIVKNLKGIVNEINNIKTLMGIGIKLENIGVKDITITNIRLYDGNITASLSEVIKYNEDFNQITNISSILGYRYNYESIVEGDINLSIKALETNQIIIPIKYLKDVIINKVGMEITYLIDNEEKKLYIDEFIYFVTSLTEMELNNLKYYTYANN